jgi:DNA-binding transcriptional LysR family regulator
MSANIDFRLLLAFEAIMETRSVTAAAERLDMTQPGLSTALARLRRRFNDPLFVRTSRGMEPTPRAIELAVPLQEALMLIRRTMDRAPSFDPLQSSRRFNLIMTDIGDRVFLPRLLQRLKHVAPGIGIATEQLPIGEARRALESGAMDLAVGFLPGLQAGFYQQRLFGQRYVCIVRRDHPLIGESLSRKQFTDTAHAAVVSFGTGHDVVEKVLETLGIRRRIAVTNTHFLAAAHIVARTDLIVIVPRVLVEAYLDILDVKLLDPPVKLPTFDVQQHWHERFHRDPANRWLRSVFMELFSDKGETMSATTSRGRKRPSARTRASDASRR